MFFDVVSSYQKIKIDRYTVHTQLLNEVSILIVTKDKILNSFGVIVNEVLDNADGF